MWSLVSIPSVSYAQLADTPWPMFRHNLQHTGRSPYVGPSLPKLKWSYSTGDDILSSPAIGADGTIYVGSGDYKLHAINPDGTSKWSYSTEREIYSSPAIGADGTIYVGSYDNKLYALGQGELLTITTTSLANGVQKATYSQTLSATGGIAPYTWSLSTGSLPTGLSLSSGGIISGTPTITGTFSFTIQVQDSGPPKQTATQALSITISPPPNRPPILSPIGAKTVEEGKLLTFTITATDPDNDPLTYRASNLPPGAGFDPATRKFSWAPSYEQAGIYPNIRFEVNDGSFTVSKDITITVKEVCSTDIKRPQPQVKVSGDAVIIEAVTKARENLGMEFYYRASDTNTWLLIGKGIPIKKDSAQDPLYQVLWNTVNLKEGNYHLKAVTKGKTGDIDKEPPQIVVTVDHQTSEHVEIGVGKDKDNVVERADKIQLKIPAGAIDSDTILRLSKPKKEELPPPKANPLGLYLRVELESGQRELKQIVTISIPYPDADHNGIVDGTNIPERSLEVNRWEGAKWERLPTEVNTVNNIVTGKTAHLTIFGVFGSPKPFSKETVYNYPNPFNPKKEATNIRFTLEKQAKVKIEIFNIAGELIWSEELTAEPGETKVLWEGRNKEGKIVATGVYLLKVEAEGKRVIKKIAVGR